MTGEEHTMHTHDLVREEMIARLETYRKKSGELRS